MAGCELGLNPMPLRSSSACHHDVAALEQDAPPFVPPLRVFEAHSAKRFPDFSSFSPAVWIGGGRGNIHVSLSLFLLLSFSSSSFFFC